MKPGFKIISTILCMILFTGLLSCEKRTDVRKANGTLEISFMGPEELSAVKSALSDSSDNSDSIHYTSFQLLISVSDINDEFLFEDKLLPLYSFGNSYVSSQIEIPSGDYYLNKFMVLNTIGEVIYASPMQGSSRAYLVNQALPIYFSINPEQTTQLAPEVLQVNGFSPSDFGYASFVVQVVNPLIFYVKCSDAETMTMPPYPEVKTILEVYTPDGWWHSFSIDTTVNKLELRGSDIYNMVIYRDGYPEQRFSLNATLIMATSEDNPYVIETGAGSYNTLILQPGPDEGKDAWISDIEPDSNFGSHNYFESAFLPDSILTVMRTTRSLVNFDLGQLPKSATILSVTLTLWYDIPIPWESDSSWLTNRKSCNCLLYGASLQQVIEPWEEYEVTWNNQPQTTGVNQVLVFPFIKNANFLDIDVTGIFVPNPYIDSIPFPNYGMMLELNPDFVFPGFRFTSSDYPDPDMRPRITITYSLPGN